MICQLLHETHRPVAGSKQAQAYDPPVERSSWRLNQALGRAGIFDQLKSALKMDDAALEKIFWHGGFYLNRKRIAQDSFPSALEPGSEIEIYRFLREPEEIEIKKESILYDEDGILAFNKPAWLPIQSTRVSARFNLEESLRKMTGQPELMAAHRLDRQTSGVVLFVRHQKAASWIMKQFASRVVHKKYVAVVQPIPPRKEWEVKGYLARDFKRLPQIFYRLTDKERPKARLSHTQFTLLGQKENLALVQAVPLTGRTHQIRVHLASSGCPILADALYGEKSSDLANRIQLHAEEIQFYPPQKGKPQAVCLQASRPSDFIWK